jgi:hypothetical protein
MDQIHSRRIELVDEDKLPGADSVVRENDGIMSVVLNRQALADRPKQVLMEAWEAVDPIRPATSDPHRSDGQRPRGPTAVPDGGERVQRLEPGTVTPRDPDGHDVDAVLIQVA